MNCKIALNKIGFGALCLCALLAIAGRISRADAEGDKKRALMATVKRVIIIPPFFGTDTMSKAASLPKSASQDAVQSQVDQTARLAAYAEQLRKLTEHATDNLP